MAKENNIYQNSMQDERITNIEEHCSIMNSELGAVKENLAQVKNDVDWLKRSYWVIATASIGGLVAAIFNLFK